MILRTENLLLERDKSWFQFVHEYIYKFMTVYIYFTYLIV